jgi:hypothetical protein
LAAALAIKQLQGNQLSMANTEAAMARLSLLAGDANAASVHLEAARTLRDDRLPAGHPSHRDEAIIEIEILLLSGQLNEARDLLGEQQALAKSAAIQATMLRLNGLLAAAEDDPAEALSLLRQSWDLHASATGERSPLCRKVAADLARLLRLTGQDEKARRYQKLAKPPE